MFSSLSKNKGCKSRFFAYQDGSSEVVLIQESVYLIFPKAVYLFWDGSSTLLAGVAKTSSGHIPPSFLISGNKDNPMNYDLQLFGLKYYCVSVLSKNT